jgi:hypothetical protein
MVTVMIGDNGMYMCFFFYSIWKYNIPTQICFFNGLKYNLKHDNHHQTSECLLLEPILIGAIRKENEWMWEKVERSLTDSSLRQRRSHGNKESRSNMARKQRRSLSSSHAHESTVEVPIKYFKWFPGTTFQ